MMTIKGVQNGKAIPMGAKESLPKAVILACSQSQDDAFIYWAKEETMDVTTFNVQDAGTPGIWVAQTAGTVMVGKTKKQTDQFFEPKKYNFKITFRNASDNLGLPTIKLDSFEIFQDKVVDVGAAQDS